MLFRMNVFLCFKQKTAYEMRISDWSSDVCSSDLGDQAVLGASPDDRVEDARSLIEDGRAVDEPAIGIAVKGADHGAGLRIDLVPALLSPDVEDHVAAAPVDHGAREARVAIERRHGLPSSAVGVVLPGRGATHAGAAVDRKSTRLNSSH